MQQICEKVQERMIRRIHTCMQDDYADAIKVLEVWTQVVRNFQWTHWLNFNPCVAGLIECEVQLFGEQIATRIRDRLGLEQGKILLVPEVSGDSMWHYHGFASVLDKRRSHLLDVNGERWATSRMNSLIQHRYPTTRALSIQPTAAIQARHGTGLGAETYSLKNGIQQGKHSRVIWV